MTRIVHLTDLHFGAEDPAVVEALSTDIATDPPDLVAVSGDLTQGARLTEFRAARAFLDRLPAPWLAVPGNHDITPYHLVERFFDPYRRWREEIAPMTEPSWQDGQVAVLGLNTARRMRLHWDWSLGRIGDTRLRALLERARAVPDTMAVVVLAHHPLMPPETAPDTPVAKGARRALAAFAQQGVKLVLSGHLHRGYSRLAAPNNGPPLILQGSTSTSVRLRGEPNAYNRITFEDGRFSVVTRVWLEGRWTMRAPEQAETTAS